MAGFNVVIRIYTVSLHCDESVRSNISVLVEFFIWNTIYPYIMAEVQNPIFTLMNNLHISRLLNPWPILKKCISRSADF